jgi:hypothetical protein
VVVVVLVEDTAAVVPHLLGMTTMTVVVLLADTLHVAMTTAADRHLQLVADTTMTPVTIVMAHRRVPALRSMTTRPHHGMLMTVMAAHRHHAVLTQTKSPTGTVMVVSLTDVVLLVMRFVTGLVTDLVMRLVEVTIVDMMLLATSRFNDDLVALLYYSPREGKERSISVRVSSRDDE